MKKIKHLSSSLSLSIAAAASLFAASALAAPVTYTVDQVVGTGSVTGSITTDGATGILTQADITGFSLLLSDAASNYAISSADSVVYLAGLDVTADASHIYFDYSGADSGTFLFEQNLFSGSHYYCSATATGICRAGESVVPSDVFSDPGFPSITPSGVQVIASTTAPVPEPETYALMALGLAGLALGARLRKSAA